MYMYMLIFALAFSIRSLSLGLMLKRLLKIANLILRVTPLTLCLPVLSADYLRKQFGPRSDRTKCWQDCEYTGSP